METLIVDPNGRKKTHGTYSNLYKLAIAGGAAFWLTNFAISLTPIATEYRAALSISYLPMLVESLVGGLIVGFFVSFTLIRFFEKIPTKEPIIKSLILSSIALIVVTVLLEGPSRYLMPGDALRYFLIGALINVLRLLALGIVIGYLYKKMHGPQLADKGVQVA
jgi:hypothetical protein